MNITDQYRSMGVQAFYENEHTKQTYINPHADFINDSVKMTFFHYFTENVSVLDLCCGNGLVSSLLKSCGVNDIEGADKYMYERYTEETGFKCYPYTFEDIADFNVHFDKFYDVIICSYAFDLVPESYRNKLLYALSTYTDTLILVRPNSHQQISDFWDIEFRWKVVKSTAMVYKKKERHS